MNRSQNGLFLLPTIIAAALLASCGSPMRPRSASRPAPLVNPAPAATPAPPATYAPGATAPPAYDASAFDISGRARLPGATLADRIAYLKAHAAYAPGPTSDETYLRLRVDGVSFRATLGEFSEPTPQFRLIIASDNGDECLWLALASDRASKVEYLSSARTCPFYPMPEKKMGDYILTVIDKLCLSLGIPRSILRDRSHVPCSSVDGEVSLAALQVMKTGKTWYENRAYVVSGSLEEPTSSLK